MKVTMPKRLSAATLWTCVLLTMFGLAPISVRMAIAQGKGEEVAPNAALPRVTAVTGRIEIGQFITVHVEHLANWAATNDPRKLVLYLNGRALNGLYPEEINLSKDQLLFHIRRTPESKKVWENLLHEPVLSRPVSLSVGLEHQSPFETSFDFNNRLSLTVIPKTRGIVSLAIMLGVSILFGYLSLRTNILREPGPRPAPGKFRPYDLGLVQTAFWFFLIATSYLGIWLITGDLDILTPSILGLIGISVITSLLPRLIGNRNDDLGQSVATQNASTIGSSSKGFFTDILSDDSGYSFPRFQICLWTLMLGVVFVCSVFDNLAMPRFSSFLLALTGISAGTFLGFELIGKRSMSDVVIN